MASLRDIRKRINSVKSTRKLTRAMKMVSGAKLRRATDSAIAARPFSAKLQELTLGLLSTLEEIQHPLMLKRDVVRRVRLIVFSSDRGMCGSFNSNMLRQMDRFLQEQSADVSLVTIGKRGRDHSRRRGYQVESVHVSVTDAERLVLVQDLARSAMADFASEKIDACYLVFNRFKSALSQVPTFEPLLPFQVEAQGAESNSQSLFEPSPAELLDALLPKMVENRVQQAFLESAASEHAARMMAMDNATRNASELINSLTLQYNRARQAAITKELVEIVSGAEAL